MSGQHTKPTVGQRAKQAAWSLVDWLVTMAPVHREAKRVLIVRLDNIGDFVVWLDAAQILVEHYKKAGKEVILVASKEWSAWARELEIFDRVIAVDRMRCAVDMVHRFQAELEIRRLGCSIVVAPGYSTSLYKGDAIVRTCGAAERTGYVGDRGSEDAIRQRLESGLYTRLVPAKPGKMTEMERNAEFLSGLLETNVPVKIAELRTPAAEKRSAEIVARLGIDGSYYVMFPGASTAGRRWPIANFKEIAKRTHLQTGWLGVVCGGPGDKGIAEELCTGTEAPVLNCAGRTSLSELAGTIMGAELLLSNETSAIHIAAAVGVPSVCLLGGGHIGRFLPYVVGQENRGVAPLPVMQPMECFDCNWVCIYEVAAEMAKPCVARIAVEDVWKEIAPLLERDGMVRRG